MACHATQFDFVATPISKKVSWVNIDGESASPGREGVSLASTKDSTYINVATAGTTELSCHATSDRVRQEAASTSPGERPRRSQFVCSLCPERKQFTQSQGLLRHHREKHEPGYKCFRPDCDYGWTTSCTYEYRKHLNKKHGLLEGEVNEILALPPITKSDPLPPHFSPPPTDVRHATPPHIQPVAHNPRLWNGEPEITTIEHGDCGLEHLAATHAPSKLLSKVDSALVKEHFQIHGQFRFPLDYQDTANTPPSPGMSHIPALTAQQPGMQRQWLSATPPASYPALPPPTHQTPPAPSQELWDDTYLSYLAMLRTQDHPQLWELLARTTPEVVMPLMGQSLLSQTVILTLVHRLACAIGESALVNESSKPSTWWPQGAATMPVLNTKDPLALTQPEPASCQAYSNAQYDEAALRDPPSGWST